MRIVLIVILGFLVTVALIVWIFKWVADAVIKEFIKGIWS